MIFPPLVSEVLHTTFIVLRTLLLFQWLTPWSWKACPSCGFRSSGFWPYRFTCFAEGWSAFRKAFCSEVWGLLNRRLQVQFASLTLLPPWQVSEGQQFLRSQTLWFISLLFRVTFPSLWFFWKVLRSRFLFTSFR